MSAPTPAALAAMLEDDERQALLALPAEGHGRVPSEAVTAALLFGHAIPLIAVTGDYARLNRTGAAVRRILEQQTETA